jgi:hypothetical protein
MVLTNPCRFLRLVRCAVGRYSESERRREKNSSLVSIELTPDDLREIDRAASQITVHGARYPEQLEQLTGR